MIHERIVRDKVFYKNSSQLDGLYDSSIYAEADTMKLLLLEEYLKNKCEQGSFEAQTPYEQFALLKGFPGLGDNSASKDLISTGYADSGLVSRNPVFSNYDIFSKTLETSLDKGHMNKNKLPENMSLGDLLPEDLLPRDIVSSDCESQQISGAEKPLFGATLAQDSLLNDMLSNHILSNDMLSSDTLSSDLLANERHAPQTFTNLNTYLIMNDKKSGEKLLSSNLEILPNADRISDIDKLSSNDLQLNDNRFISKSAMNGVSVLSFDGSFSQQQNILCEQAPNCLGYLIRNCSNSTQHSNNRRMSTKTILSTKLDSNNVNYGVTDKSTLPDSEIDPSKSINDELYELRPSISEKISAFASFQESMSKTRICCHNLKGHCTRGEDCAFAHSVDELRPPPNLYKTRLCINFINFGNCSRGESCRFAHGKSDMRIIQPLHNTYTGNPQKNIFENSNILSNNVNSTTNLSLVMNVPNYNQLNSNMVNLTRNTTTAQSNKNSNVAKNLLYPACLPMQNNTNFQNKPHNLYAFFPSHQIQPNLEFNHSAYHIINNATAKLNTPNYPDTNSAHFQFIDNQTLQINKKHYNASNSVELNFFKDLNFDSEHPKYNYI